jgi:hypothetical protein
MGVVMMSRQMIGWVTAVVFVIGTVCAGAAPVTPATEAGRFSRALRAAAMSADVQEVIVELLDSLGVPVCNAAGQSIGQHPRTSADLCVYEVEVRAVSRAFLGGTLTPLDTLAADWAREGATCDGYEPCDGQAIEAILRQMREQAEMAPEDWQGYLIRLVDDLGQRTDRPFSLLGSVDPTCSTAASGAGIPTPSDGAAATASGLSSVFGDIARQAEEEGDAEVASMFRAMQSAGNLEQMMGSLARGDVSVLMQLMGDEGEPEEDPYGAEQLSDPIGEGFAGVNMRPLMSGGGPATGQQIQSQANEITRELAQREVDFRQNELSEHVAQVREGLTPEDHGVTGLIDIGNDEISMGFNIEQAKANYRFADWEVQVLEHIWKDPPEDESWKQERRGILAGGTDETTSCIYLDAVQVLLLHIELLDMAHPVRAKGGI